MAGMDESLNNALTESPQRKPSRHNPFRLTAREAFGVGLFAIALTVLVLAVNFAIRNW
jgi:hypothetical protein